VIEIAVKEVNDFFKSPVKPEIQKLEENLLLTDLQYKIYKMKYIEKHDINFIADELNCSRAKINSELKNIRAMILKLI
jgi:predicted DNA-binding protein YlxM (UPF0122 family)